MHHQVTGTANENQVCEALRRYRDCESLVREALAHLHDLIADNDKPRPDILKVLRFIPATCLQISASASLTAVHGCDHNANFTYERLA